MDDAGAISECNGLDYVMDLVSELELCPAFPVVRSNLLKAGTKHHSPVEIDHHKQPTVSPARPQVFLSSKHYVPSVCYSFLSLNLQIPPPEPPVSHARKISREISRQSPQSPIIHQQQQQPSSRKSSRDTHHEYSPQRESPRITSTPARKPSQEALSRSSALNERYFEIEKARSRSLDNLLSEPEPNPFMELGLSQSKLNER